MLRMEMTGYDALVIGGGPGGSSAAAFLARAGRRVLVHEKEVFPRFNIGESLLPYNQSIFRELGVLPKLEAAGFTRKSGAQFHLANGSKSLFLVFRNGIFTRHAEAFQVERATFDHLLLNHARESGAEVREGWTVTKFESSADSIAVEARGPDDTVQLFRAPFLIDASGRGNLTGNQEGLRQIHPHLKKLAVFGHFSGVALDTGEKAGDTVIVRLENKWFWIIPLSKEKVSVGCVIDKEEFARDQGSPEQVFQRIWNSSPVLRARMRDARLLGAVQTTSDFSYRNRRLVGHRLMRVGDAAGFMDPIFSAGVYLAMHSGKLSARLVDESLKAGSDGRDRLARYERRVNHSMSLYWKMVEGYYTTPFMEMFMQPRHKLHLPSAVTALLAGELEGGWAVRWRMKLFFLLVKLQARWPLVPRISFAPHPDMADKCVESATPREEVAHHL
jgi:FADH2-dependent halogenase